MKNPLNLYIKNNIKLFLKKVEKDLIIAHFLYIFVIEVNKKLKMKFIDKEI